ncbi:hypothetical protein AYO20_04857 [Fonsecaea nubica]|uniref:Uncharacterized protein n=1 Tax=Fonsecaea nubica TaxID=856822 RepID=A0A178D443_9EURO|nr:hypothetical protein AYO20_04857 [Fonsecaea nubica]OAL35951.1 hypothetical protein AYO20_04857 [Fonsecaea nubica]
MAPASSATTFFSPAQRAPAPIRLSSLPAGTPQISVHASSPPAILSPSLLRTANSNATPIPAGAAQQQAMRTIRKTRVCTLLPCGSTSIGTKKSLAKWAFNLLVMASSILGLAYMYVDNSRAAWTARKDFREDCFNQRVSSMCPPNPNHFPTRFLIF